MLKGYVSEAGSPSVHAARARFAARLFLTTHVVLEVLTTLAKLLRAREIDRQTYVRARSEFLADCARDYQMVEVDEGVVLRSYVLADAHRQVSIGAMDLLHLSAALELQRMQANRPLVVASADRGLLAVAVALGLSTFDPETEPFSSLLAKVGQR
ncbi:MAG: type II toxin-antitoxin system VapC family toxin [Gemmatimonadetes bacterium]|nr:type II toxin-antitoxin system VapC family toxin [Gemmatimonadota bacterium]